MNVFKLAWNYLFAKPLSTVLNIVLLGLGVGVITILILFNNQFEEKIIENVRGIDLVVGAKGSPMQLILCNIFHIDFPTGNINLAEAEKLSRNRLIKEAIPLALGDSYAGYRIIGTTEKYPALYDAQLSEGSWWKNIMQVVIGSNVAHNTGLKKGDRFTSNHGLSEDGHFHEDNAFEVAGIMKRQNTVMDNLILASVQSIWKVHDHEGEDAAVLATDSTQVSPLVPGHIKGDSTREITSMLIQYRSPMGAIQLPRIVNSQSSFQAASPAFETARLFSILGVGIDIIKGFGYLLVFISALSIFIALYNALKERKYDLAIMRAMGASKQKLFFTIILEGVSLTIFGSIAGLLMGHGTLYILSTVLKEASQTGISGLVFYPEEGMILVGSMLLGLVCSIVPGIEVYRTDVSKTLAEN